MKFSAIDQMRLAIISIVFLSIVGSLHAQPFEGKIRYKLTYESKTDGLTVEQLQKLLGTQLDYYIRGGSYRSILNGASTQWQLYNSADNRVYNKLSTTDTLKWIDASLNPDTLVKWNITKNKLTVMGYECDEIILTTSGGEHKYYYSPNIRINPGLYMQHKMDNFYDLIKLTNALPLKWVIGNDKFTITFTAIEIRPAHLDDMLFQLPKRAVVAPLYR